MGDELPRLIGLVLAGLVAMMGLRAQLGDTPQGERVFKVVLVAFLLVIGFAIYALFRQGGAGVQPDSEAPTTVADRAALSRLDPSGPAGHLPASGEGSDTLRRPAAPGDGAVAYVDNIAGASHKRSPASGEAAAA